MCSHLQHLSTYHYDPLLLLHHSIVIPKLLHILRTSPCFASPVLLSYDDELRSILSTITNVHIETNGPTLFQASLPVKFGGLGGLGVSGGVQLSSLILVGIF